MNSLACFYTLVHKFPTDTGAIQVLCSNLFFGPPLPRPCLLPAQIGYARGQARAYSPSFSRFWWGKIDQSQVLWSVASCDANYKIESLLQKVDLTSTLRNTLPQLATQQVVRKCCPYYLNFMQHIETCLLWDLNLTEFCVNLRCF